MGAKKIDKYELLKELGNGSVGVVYKARDPRLNRPVAIKVLKTISLGDSSDQENLSLKRFYHEAQLACMLRHPNIVTIFDAGVTESGAPYIVMEYIEGKDLGDMIDERGSIPPEEILRYLTPIAKAIDYAHTQGIIHRDIKPNNIVISNAGVPYLLDFSIAKLHDTSLTPAGTLLGTPEYMAPEQIMGYKLDHRVDLFAFAVVAFEALTGTLPFSANDLMGTATMIVKNPPRKFKDINCPLPEELESTLHHGLAKTPEKRFQSAEEMVSAIANALARNLSSQHKTVKLSNSDLEPVRNNISSEINYPTTPRPRKEEEWQLDSEQTDEYYQHQQPLPQFSDSGNQSSMDSSTTRSSSLAPVKLAGMLFCFATIAGFVYYLLFSFFGSHSPITSPTNANATSTILSNQIKAEPTQEPEPPAIDPSKLSLPELSAILSAKTPNLYLLRQAIPEASRRGFPELLKLSVNYVRHPDYFVKIEVLKLLIANPHFMSAQERFALVSGMLNDSDYLVRGFVVKTLSSIGSKEAIELIEQHKNQETNSAVLRVIADDLARLKK